MGIAFNNYNTRENKRDGVCVCKYPEREQVRLPLRVSKERKKKEKWESGCLGFLALALVVCKKCGNIKNIIIINSI